MAAGTSTLRTAREPQLAGQTVVLIGGSAGIGLETARRAPQEGDRRPGRVDPERARSAQARRGGAAAS
jgi:NAD(P)-dependent dehydrogenase (short-subunit alcohol dehydrogenase family)